MAKIQKITTAEISAIITETFESEEAELEEKFSKDATNYEYKEKISEIKNNKIKKSLIELSNLFKKK